MPTPSSTWRVLKVVSLVGMAHLSTGCTTLGYYWQSIHGQLDIMSKRESIDALVEHQDTPAALREKLEQVQAIRAFAVQSLALPAGGSYQSYADVGRPYVVWVVAAAPEFSLAPEQWCFPIIGCVSYRGYFAEQDAREFAAGLREQGLDVYVGGVRAYSTLGWFDDPLLNTIVWLPEHRLAGIVFHELAHQRVYVAGDTAFNESYATAVEEAGVERWLAVRKDGKESDAYRASQRHQKDFLRLTRGARAQLATLYESGAPDEEKRQAKAEILRILRLNYEALKRTWGGFDGYDRWFANDLNNAKFALASTYHNRVAAFAALLDSVKGDMGRFHQEVEKLSKVDREERNRRLEVLSKEYQKLGLAHEP